ncbi:MAG TPA: hypothetical protein VMH33_11930 [Solirubrobacterales bacterium]|nr:hypothetical protein [Solirubrobacterales bacterium]
MKRRIAVVVLAVFALSLVAGAATSEAGSSSIVPYEGRYLGVDTHHRSISFEYRHGKIKNFKVNHTLFPEATVSGSRWHHTCMNNHCTRGEWLDDYAVKGFWNISNSGGDVVFEANAIAF